MRYTRFCSVLSYLVVPFDVLLYFRFLALACADSRLQL